jgi:hypothetical protein
MRKIEQRRQETEKKKVALMSKINRLPPERAWVQGLPSREMIELYAELRSLPETDELEFQRWREEKPFIENARSGRDPHLGIS